MMSYANPSAPPSDLSQASLLPLTLSALLTLAGCDSDTPPPPRLEGGARAIVGGERERGHPEVVALTTRAGALTCTGVLIAPQTVLTAAHCIGPSAAPHPPHLAEVGAVVGDSINERARVVAYRVHEGYLRAPRAGEGAGEGAGAGESAGAGEGEGAGASAGEGASPAHDLALLYLESPLSPTPALLSSSPVEAGREVKAVGYGVSNGFTQSGAGVRRSVPLEVLYSDPARDGAWVASWRGEAPQDTCQGDSGGPALTRFMGETLVWGLVSSGPLFCQGRTHYAPIAANREWIEARRALPAELIERSEAGAGAEAGSGSAAGAGAGAGASDLVTLTLRDSRPHPLYSRCAQSRDCLRSCSRYGLDDYECLDICGELSTHTAYSHLIELLECEARSGCEGDLECLSADCPQQRALCDLPNFEPWPADGERLTTCAALSACVGGCEDGWGDYSERPEGEGICVQRCYARATPVAADALNALESCELWYACHDEGCREARCGEQARACAP